MELPINKNKPLVMHIDLNSCFATCEQQANIHLRDKPLVIAAYDSPRGCIVAPSIEAKRFGIKTGMRVMEAKLLCRDVIVRTPDTDLIRDIHTKFKKIFCDYSISVTPKSIDEAVIDFKPMEHLLNKPLVEIGMEIKNRMKLEIGEWIRCSIGIGTNRFLAKTGVSLKKPDGLEVINHENLREVYSRLKLVELCGINKKFEARLNVCGIYNPVQFLDTPMEVLKKQVFKSIVGYHWYSRLRGYEIDDIEFERKSYGQDFALGKKTSDPEELSRILMKLCEKMGRRLRRSGSIAHGIHIMILYTDGTFWHRQKITDKNLYTTPELYQYAQLVFNMQPERKEVRKLSIACYDLSKNDISQSTLFDSGEDNKIYKEHKLYEAVDKMNDRYGEFTITPLRMIGMNDLVLDRIAFGGVKELEDLYSLHPE